MFKEKFMLQKSDDNKFAWLTIFDFKNLKIPDVQVKIKALGIHYGLKNDILSKMFLDKSAFKGKKTLIAEYSEPGDGTEELISYVDLSCKPQEKKGKMDYYNINYVKDVKKNICLFSYLSAFNSQFGVLTSGELFTKNNFGEKKIKIECPYAGENIILRQDGNRLKGYAGINGSLVYKNERFNVLTCVLVKDNLDFHTGNLFSHYSDFKIERNITNNFVVETAGSLEVGGNIENSTIKVKSLTVKNQIMRGNKEIFVKNKLIVASILNRNNLYCQNLQVSKVVHNSEIGVLGKAKICTIAEGKLYVKEVLEVDNLGSDSAKNTVVNMGQDKYILDQIVHFTNELSKQKKTCRSYRIERVKLANLLDQKKKIYRENKLAEDKEKVLIEIDKLEEDMKFLVEDLLKEEKKESDILNILSKYKNKDEFNPNAIIYVKKKLYPGSVIRFGPVNKIRISKFYNSCKIFLGAEHEIVIKECLLTGTNYI